MKKKWSGESVYENGDDVTTGDEGSGNEMACGVMICAEKSVARIFDI